MLRRLLRTSSRRFHRFIHLFPPFLSSFLSLHTLVGRLRTYSRRVHCILVFGYYNAKL